MMKKYKLALNGLNCAHCAGKIETAVAQNDRYNNVSLNFATRSLNLESKHDEHSVIEHIQSIVDNIEDGVTVSGTKDEEKKHYGFLIAACVFFASGIVFDFLTDIAVVPLILYALSALSCGYEIFLKGIKSLLKLKPDETALLTVAVVAAFCIGEGLEAALVTLLFAVGELLEDLAVGNSRKSIEELTKIRPDKAMLLQNGKTSTVKAESVNVGDLIFVAPFERIPLDGNVINGTGSVDSSALTGESKPLYVENGSAVMSGMVNGENELTLRVTNTYEKSAASRIIELVESAAAVKGNSEKIITRFARIYTPAVMLIAVLVAVVPSLFGYESFSVMLYRALVLLVASCPCAIVISVPLSFYAGIGAASKQGVLIKGGKYLEALSRADAIAFDKTGTLTTGRFEVSDISTANNFSSDEALSLAAAAEKLSSHPIASAIREAAAKKNLNLPQMNNYRETPAKGVTANYNEYDVICGQKSLLEQNGIKCNVAGDVFVASNGKLVAGISLSDLPRAESPAIIHDLKKLGFNKIAMFTGDKKASAESVAEKCGISDVNAELLPQDKVSLMQKLTSISKASVFVGDGINDSPVLAAADCGVAMGLGSEAAIEAADIVLTDGTPSKLPTAVKLARRAMSIVRFNIAFALAVKAVVLILAVVGYAPMWLAVMADTGLSVLCVLNSVRLLKTKKK